jgi:cell division protein FtsQ
MKRLKYIVIWLLIAGYLGVILGFVSKEEGKLTCTGLSIIIHDSLNMQFVDYRLITRLLQMDGIALTGRAINDINLQEIEERILSVRAIRTAEVYFTVRGKLVVEVYQRKPVVRIIDRSGQSYYIDEEGYLMPVSGNFSSHVLVVNGKISEECRKAKYIGEQGKGMDLLRNIFRMACFIRNDEFWNAQIMQIYVNDRQEFELVPRVGAHIIEFGSADEIEKKFDMLWILYDEGFRNKGWNRYDRINLKYRNQVICTKR